MQIEQESAKAKTYGTKVTGGKTNDNNAKFHTSGNVTTKWVPKTDISAANALNIKPRIDEVDGVVSIIANYTTRTLAGKGFLYGKGNDRFIITAAHVLGLKKDNKELVNLYIEQDKVIIREDGERQTVTVTTTIPASALLPSGKISDLAVFQISDIKLLLSFKTCKKVVGTEGVTSWDDTMKIS